jgi:hypothetical protein
MSAPTFKVELPDTPIVREVTLWLVERYMTRGIVGYYGDEYEEAILTIAAALKSSAQDGSLLKREG